MKNSSYNQIFSRLQEQEREMMEIESVRNALPPLYYRKKEPTKEEQARMEEIESVRSALPPLYRCS